MSADVTIIPVGDEDGNPTGGLSYGHINPYEFLVRYGNALHENHSDGCYWSLWDLADMVPHVKHDWAVTRPDSEDNPTSDGLIYRWNQSPDTPGAIPITRIDYDDEVPY